MPRNLFSQETLTKLHFILNPEVSTWPFIWFYTLVFTVLISSQLPWFRRVPEISNPTGLNGGVPITANIAKQNRASLLAVLARTAQRNAALFPDVHSSRFPQRLALQETPAWSRGWQIFSVGFLQIIITLYTILEWGLFSQAWTTPRDLG